MEGAKTWMSSVSNEFKELYLRYTDNDFINEISYRFVRSRDFDPLKFLSAYKDYPQKLWSWFIMSSELDSDVLEFFSENIPSEYFSWYTDDYYIHLPEKDALFFQKLPPPTNSELIIFLHESEHEYFTEAGFSFIWQIVVSRIPSFTSEEKEEFKDLVERAVNEGHWPILDRSDSDAEFFRHPLVDEVLNSLAEDKKRSERLWDARSKVSSSFYDLLLWYDLDRDGDLDRIVHICESLALNDITLEQARSQMVDVFAKDGIENFEYDKEELYSYINEYFTPLL